MVISASRIPCILSIPNLTLILLENPESRPSNKANPGSRETLRGGKKTKRCEKRAGAGERPAYRKSLKISPSKYKPPQLQIGDAKNPPLNRPSKYKPPGGLYLENCPQIQSKTTQKR